MICVECGHMTLTVSGYPQTVMVPVIQMMLLSRTDKRSHEIDLSTDYKHSQILATYNLIRANGWQIINDN